MLSPEEFEYYNTEASEYLKMLPSDKKILSLLINDSCHHIFYYERSKTPSCYVYDLESLTTSVLFGSEAGLQADDTMLYVGSIIDWRRIGDNFVFIARNRDEAASFGDAVIIFSVGMYDNSKHFLDYAARAQFTDDSQITATYVKMPEGDNASGEGEYSKYSVEMDLSKLI